ncbi:hypothetical protein CGMCC3_g16634 [Colletotrichum fructicola]|uniref:WSC domain-containing protein n=1 Tax=Colletotrichum fructicola (strain Nara gc5) TaxID=1213859 RepID=A0A7J6IBN1_COLFN|nr:uncharacterized protein CGMCC3_g16634 [Colletotrichum fructicola]KAE9567213.1 hypothetical protein CGMCC3_g16634 [Colletotrichum fructicola]KAF4473634.1 WSC domain-containing protein [Colletotrichum fructicola Nara gc5]KAF4882778.1 WSC domain-containing protein [Colletotrichum fructicola]
MILSSLASAALWLAMMPREAGASAVHLGKRGETPQANVLADTIKSCSYWYDNYEGESCVVVRDYMFAISPETFSRWNPSVGLDCSNWQDWTSYCIQVASEEPPKTTTTTASTTTTVPAQSQTPTAVLTGWNPMGCFIDDHTLATESTKAGGSSLTVDKCQAACWSEGFRYAGVKSGTECWCGSFVGGDWAANQTSCNVPCPGDAKQTCGGKALLLVFEAQVKTNPLPPISIPSTTSRTTAITSSSVSLTSSTSTPSSTALPPISSLPACGQTCFLNMINTYSSLGCSTPDPACLCRNVNFGYGIRDCSNAVCGVADASAVIAYQSKYCASALATATGGTATPTSATKTTSASSTTAITSLPTCGQTCFNNMLAQYESLGCTSPDPSCLCRNVNFGYGLRDCSNGACGTNVASTVIAYGSAYCAAATATAAA